MKKLFRGFLALFLVGVNSLNWINAQQLAKSDDEMFQLRNYLQKVYSMDPQQLLLQQEAADQLSESFDGFSERLANSPMLLEGRSRLIIPVVVHNIYEAQSMDGYVNDQRVEEAIQMLNADFNMNNAFRDNIAKPFRAIEGNAGIEFRLAQIDPDGNHTTGVTRHQSWLTYNGSWEHPEVKRICSWPRDRYLNIWVVYSSDGASGSAWTFLPSQVAETSGREDLDGIVISEWALGKKTPGFYSILTHEIGHYLGLENVWGEAKLGSPAACSADDGIQDTSACNGLGGTCDLYCITCGTLDNVQNFMNGSQCACMFTLGQVNYMRNTLSQSVSGRNNLCTVDNYQQTFIFEEPRIASLNGGFKENLINDGSILGPVQLALHDIEYAPSGQLEEGIHYEVANVPAGLTPIITVKNKATAEVVLVGNAEKHLKENSIDNLDIVFKEAAFCTDFDKLINPTFSFAVQYIDFLPIVYHPFDIVEVPTNNGKMYSWFVVPDFTMDYSAFIDKNQDDMLMLDTYQKPIVCEVGTRNVSFLQKGAIVGAGSNWEAAGEYPDLHVLKSDDYTIWQGQKAYVGIQLWKSDINGDNHYYYGYLELKVNAEGTTYEVLGVAYNPVPGEPIVTGVAASQIIVDHQQWYEDDDNDGSISTCGNMRLLSDQFTKKTGEYLEEGTHYTVSNLPVGLDFLVYLDDVNNARLSIRGNAEEHALSDSCEVEVKFCNAAFRSDDAKLVKNSSMKLSFHFRDEYRIVYEDVEDFTVSRESPWKLYNLGYRNASFGVWFDSETNTTRFELYEDEGVSFDGSRNLRPLKEGTIIHEGMNWVAGDNFPDEHNIATPDFREWHGKDGFIGMRYASGDHYFYGWVHIQVAADGSAYTILEYAFNENLDQPILAGSQQATPMLTWGNHTFQESKMNNGTFEEEINGELYFCEFIIDNGVLIEGEDFMVSGLPEELSVELSVIDANHFRVALIGQLNQHERSNNAEFDIVLQDAAFKVLNSRDLYGCAPRLDISCWDAIDVNYVNNLDEKVDALKPWYPFYIHESKFGIFHMDYNDETTLRFETFQQRMVCENGSTHLTPLKKGALIDQNSTWVAGGNYPDLHIVYSSEFTAWAGQIAYAGIEVEKEEGKYYGWLRFHVSEDGTNYRLLDYAIQNIPEQAIHAGEVAEGIILLSRDRICDDAATKQMFESVVDIELDGDALFTSNTLLMNRHYTLHNLPGYLNVSLLTMDESHCQLVISGDTREVTSDQVIDLELVFANEAFKSHEATAIEGSIVPIQLTFEDPYEINTGSYLTLSVSEDYTWNDFYFMDDIKGGLWFHPDNQSLYLEVYTNQVVCQPGTQNIILLNRGAAIGPDLSWESRSDNFPGRHLAFGQGYRDLAGQEGYAGIRVLKNGNWHYGWVQLSINETGTGMNTTGFGMCRRPETILPAGHCSLAHFCADKSIVQPGEQINFSDHSFTPADEWLWYFEGADQSISTQQNPQVTYSESGIYRVMLTVNSIEVKGASVVYEDYVYVQKAKGINDRLSWLDNTFQIYPNPVQDVVNLVLSDTESPAHIQLYNLEGSLIQEWILSDILNTNTLQLQNVPAGIYLLEVIQGAQKKVTRLMVN